MPEKLDPPPWIVGRETREERAALNVIEHARDPFVLLAPITLRVRMMERVLRQAVFEARANGHTWEEIATQLGITRQAANKRFSDGE